MRVRRVRSPRVYMSVNARDIAVACQYLLLIRRTCLAYNRSSSGSTVASYFSLVLISLASVF
jgi:hypothetical protein